MNEAIFVVAALACSTGLTIGSVLVLSGLAGFLKEEQ
jgi:hypothetical protein